MKEIVRYFGAGITPCLLLHPRSLAKCLIFDGVLVHALEWMSKDGQQQVKGAHKMCLGTRVSTQVSNMFSVLFQNA